MSQLDKETLKNLTKLSRIDCTEEEQDKLLHDLKRILTYIEQLNEIDTTNVPSCHHVLEDIVNVMREDEVGETLSRELFLANAPSQVDGMIRVPSIIKR